MPYLADSFIIYDGTTRADMMVGAVDPSAGAGVPATEGTLYMLDDGLGNPDSGKVYLKQGPADTEWGELAIFPPGAQGEIMYYNGTGWVAFPVGTPGYVLTTQGAAADPIWTPGVWETDRQTFVAGEQTHAIAFGVAQTSVNYSVTAAVVTAAGDPVPGVTITDKTVNGFNLTLTAPVLPGLQVDVDWEATAAA